MSPLLLPLRPGFVIYYFVSFIFACSTIHSDCCSAGNAEDVAIAVHVRPLSGGRIHQHWAGRRPATANETGPQAATKETKEEEENEQQQSDQQSAPAKSHGVELFGRRRRRRPTGGSLESGTGRNQSTPAVSTGIHICAASILIFAFSTTPKIGGTKREIEELEGALQELRTDYNVVEIESYLTMTDPGPLERLGCDSASSAVCQQHNRSIINHQTTTTTTTSTCYYYNSNDSGGASGAYCNVADDSIGSLSSSSSYHEEEEEEEEEDSSSVVNQRRCLCVVMAIVIVVFILATILGASL